MTEPERTWKELRFYKKFKYVLEILAIVGGFFVIIFYSKELAILKSQLEYNKDQLQLLNDSLDLERSKSKARLEFRFWRVIDESVHLGAKVTMDTSSEDDLTQGARKQGDTNKSTSLSTSSSDNRAQIILICRNLSPRPTAVIHVYVRDQKGGILGRRGYKNRIALPFRVEAWGLTQIDFRIERDDEKRMKDIWIKDMEDKEYIVPLGSKWVRAKQTD